MIYFKNMAIISRDELRLECDETSNLIENEIFSKHPPRRLTEEERGDIIEPFVNLLEDMAKESVEKAIDEVRGEIEDKHREEEAQQQYHGVLASISEKCILEIDGNKQVAEYDIIDRLQDDYDADRNIVLEFEKTEPSEDLDVLTRCELFSISTRNVSDIEDFVPYVKVKLREPYNSLINKDMKDVCTYIDNSDMTIEETIEFLQSLKYYKILSYDYYTNGMIESYKLMQKRRCEIVIKGGKRSGQICNRQAKRSRRCEYHFKKSGMLP